MIKLSQVLKDWIENHSIYKQWYYCGSYCEAPVIYSKGDFNDYPIFYIKDDKVICTQRYEILASDPDFFDRFEGELRLHRIARYDD